MSKAPLRTYSELIKLKTFDERFEYLRLAGVVGQTTFGFDRYLTQLCYTSSLWRERRRKIIMRDNGCDLGVEGYDIKDRIIVHHMNPLILQDLIEVSDDIFNEEYLICTSHATHNAIHYGDINLIQRGPVERKPGDTRLW